MDRKEECFLGRIKQVYWNLYEDQVQWVSVQAKGGISKGEIYRRILDSTIDQFEGKRVSLEGGG